MNGKLFGKMLFYLSIFILELYMDSIFGVMELKNIQFYGVSTNILIYSILIIK